MYLKKVFAALSWWYMNEYTKSMLTSFAWPNRLKRSSLLFIIFLLSHFSFSQKSAIENESIVTYKNAVKGFILPTPLYSTFSLGYERYISIHSLVEIVTKNQFYFDEISPESLPRPRPLPRLLLPLVEPDLNDSLACLSFSSVNFSKTD